MKQDLTEIAIPMGCSKRMLNTIALISPFGTRQVALESTLPARKARRSMGCIPMKIRWRKSPETLFQKVSVVKYESSSKCCRMSVFRVPSNHCQTDVVTKRTTVREVLYGGKEHHERGLSGWRFDVS
jgi:hypothetical protein